MSNPDYSPYFYVREACRECQCQFYVDTATYGTVCSCCGRSYQPLSASEIQEESRRLKEAMRELSEAVLSEDTLRKKSVELMQAYLKLMKFSSEVNGRRCNECGFFIGLKHRKSCVNPYCGNFDPQEPYGF